MDSVSQMVLGAAVAEATLGRRIGRRASAVGAVLGTLPDLDVLVRYADAIDSFTLHRGWSHSLFVLSLISLPLAALASRLFARAEVAFGRWWFAVWAVLITHALLDAFTTYGTQLFWPIPTPPVSIGSVFIIDPLYTLPLLVGVVLALRRRDRSGRRANLIGLGASTGYLVATLVFQQLARSEAMVAFERAGLAPQATLALPFPFGMMWRVLAREGDDYAVVWVSLIDGEQSVQVERFARGLEAIGPIDDPAPVERLKWFTHGFVGARRIDEALVLTDLRIGTGGTPIFSFTAAEAGSSGEWRRVQAEARDPVVDLSVLGQLLRRSVDAEVEMSDGELAGDPADTVVR